MIAALIVALGVLITAIGLSGVLAVAAVGVAVAAIPFL